MFQEQVIKAFGSRLLEFTSRVAMDRMSPKHCPPSRTIPKNVTAAKVDAWLMLFLCRKPSYTQLVNDCFTSIS